MSSIYRIEKGNFQDCMEVFDKLTLADIKNFFRDPEGPFFLYNDPMSLLRIIAYDNKTNTKIGFCEAISKFTNDDMRIISISIAVIPEYQNKGIGYHLLSSIEEILKNMIPNSKLSLIYNTQIDNIASIKLAEKNEYKFKQYAMDGTPTMDYEKIINNN